MAMSCPITPPSAGSKRPSIDGGDDSASKRVKGKHLLYQSPTTAPSNSNVLDKIPTRQRLAFDATDEPGMYSEDDEVVISKISFTTPDPASFTKSPAKTSFAETSFGASTVFTRAGEQPGSSQSTTVAPAASAALKESTATIKGSTTRVAKASPPTTPPAQYCYSALSDGKRPPSAASTEYQTATDRSDRSMGDVQHQAAVPSPVYSPTPEAFLPIESSEFVLVGPLKERLQNIWPPFPRWLHGAPLAVAWEITRIGIHCKVDLDGLDIKYNPAWAKGGVEAIWKDLRKLDERAPVPDVGANEPADHRMFKSFPERPSAEAWGAALGTFETKGNVVVLQASLDWNTAKTGPLFRVNLRPLQLDQGCRLTRRFGGDRFFEILIPSPTSANAPPIVSKTDGAPEQVIRWLTEQQHSLVGRKWRAFYTKDAGYRRPLREYRLEGEQKPVFKDRVHFFAESGHNFKFAPIPRPGQPRFVVPVDEPVNARTQFKVSQMLDWLLTIEENEWQPYLKLFSRIQLGLSKTFPAITFDFDASDQSRQQIINRPEDILSPAGKIMNDGIGRMSRSVARKIRDALGLSDIPSAVQGRMGSAKGMWLMDVQDAGDDDWIETYPSQRKWECSFQDPFMRTLEVRSLASELKSAGLNLQLLPVLEDRARDKNHMRDVIGKRLANDLERQFNSQKEAFNSPLQFREWLTQNFNNRAGRVQHGHVLSLGGLPQSREEVMHLMLNSGFDPRKQKYMQDIAWELQKQKCELLKTKLNIKVGQSTYVYMVVDFWGVLKEGEVHLGFSNKFRAETEDLSFTLLADCDVLVARSPAHFPSDVQKVRAVFKPELHALKDVIVFPATGDVPLADKLSGGDYDGDLAWVCWDPDLVNGFENAEVPEQPDLSNYLTKDKTTFGDLIIHSQGPNDPKAREHAVYDMITRSFLFAMQPNFLGICTNYKERLCYQNNNVGNYQAIILSTLVGNLVDQSKQGLAFTSKNWDALRRELLKTATMLPDPAYKLDNWDPGLGEPVHIIDFLKFSVAKPAIGRELSAFNKKMSSTADPNDPNAAHYYDRDLLKYHESLAVLTPKSKTATNLLAALSRSISDLQIEWARSMASLGNRGGGGRPSSSATAPANPDEETYPAKVTRLYAKWRAITLASLVTKVDPKMAALLEQRYLADPAENSLFALIKASMAFKMLYRTSPRFVFQMAGRQLAFIKAMVTKGAADTSTGMGIGGDPDGLESIDGDPDGALVLVTPLMYAGLAPDQKFARQYQARLACDGSEYPEMEQAEADGDSGERGWGFGGYDDY